MLFRKSPPRPEARSSSSSAAHAAFSQQRATLEGLEVQDSDWDEWVKCEQMATAGQQDALLDQGEGPLRRLMKQ